MDGNAAYNRLGILIRDRRVELGWSQAEFAEKAGMSQEWVSKVEAGEIPTPRVSTLRKVAEALQLPVADLYIAANLARSEAEAKRIEESVPPTYLPGSLRAELHQLLETMDEDEVEGMIWAANWMIRTRRPQQLTAVQSDSDGEKFLIRS